MNNVLFSSIFNSNYEKKIQLIAVVESGQIFYGAVFKKNFREEVGKSSVVEEKEEEEEDDETVSKNYKQKLEKLEDELEKSEEEKKKNCKGKNDG
jgi:hypothetical protein